MIVFLLAGLYTINDRSFWVDEVYSMDYIEDCLQRFSGDPNMFLYYVLLKGWMFLGDSEGHARALSVLFILLSIPGLFKIGIIFFDRRIAHTAVGLLAVNPLTLQYAQTARSYALLICLTVWTTWIFINALRRSNLVWWIAYILSASALFYTHFFGILLIGAQMLFHWFIGPKKVRELIFCGFSILLLSTPTVSAFMQSKDRLVYRSEPGLSQILKTLKAFSGDSYIALAVFAFILSVSLFWFLKTTRKKLNSNPTANSRALFFVILWLIIPILIAFLFSITIKPIYAYRYLLICYPAFLLLAAQCIWILPLKPYFSWVSIFAICLASTLKIIQYYRSDSPPWRTVVAHVIENYQTGDAVILFPYFTRYTFDFYLRRLESKRNIRVVDIAGGAYSRGGSGMDPEVDYELLKRLNESYSRVWLIFSHNTNKKLGRPERTHQIIDSMKNEYAHFEKKTFGKISMYKYIDPLLQK